MAAKLARLVYRMLRFGMDQGAELYEAKIHHLQIRRLQWQAAKLGFQLSEISAS